MREAAIIQDASLPITLLSLLMSARHMNYEKDVQITFQYSESQCFVAKKKKKKKLFYAQESDSTVEHVSNLKKSRFTVVMSQFVVTLVA